MWHTSAISRGPTSPLKGFNPLGGMGSGSETDTFAAAHVAILCGAKAKAGFAGIQGGTTSNLADRTAGEVEHGPCRMVSMEFH